MTGRLKGGREGGLRCECHAGYEMGELVVEMREDWSASAMVSSSSVIAHWMEWLVDWPAGREGEALSGEAVCAGD
jgi:hypothetical protein